MPSAFAALRLMTKPLVQQRSPGVIFRLRGAEIAYRALQKHSRTAATCCCADPGVGSIAGVGSIVFYRRNDHGDD